MNQTAKDLVDAMNNHPDRVSVANTVIDSRREKPTVGKSASVTFAVPDDLVKSLRGYRPGRVLIVWIAPDPPEFEQEHNCEFTGELAAAP